MFLNDKLFWNIILLKVINNLNELISSKSRCNVADTLNNERWKKMT